MKKTKLLFVFACCHFALVRASDKNQVHVTRCCKDGQLLINSKCHNAPNEMKKIKWSLPIFEKSGKPTRDDYELKVANVNLTVCEPGNFRMATRFKLYTDGSVSTDNEDSLWPGEFCLNPTADGETTVAQRCAPDPCKGAACVKKCCPKGMLFYTPEANAAMACHSVRNVSSNDDVLSKIDKSDAIEILYGATPTCQHDSMYMLSSSEFNMSSNGTLKDIATNFDTDEYCVETSASYSMDVESDPIAVLCYPLEKQVHVTTCCEDGQLLIDSKCHNATNAMKIKWSLPIFEKSGKLTRDDYELKVANVNLTVCEPGNFTMATRFKLYTDGSISTDNNDHEDSLWPGEFCLKLAADGETTVAQHCAPDPCKGAACVKKCCPNGMLFYTPEANAAIACHSVRNVSSNDDVLSKIDEPDAIEILYGAMPTCQHGMYMLSSSEFNIASNGTLQQTDADFATDEYCIEKSVSYSKETESDLIAVLCYPSDKHGDEEVGLKFLPYLLIVSSLFFVAVFVVYAILPRVQNVHGLTIMCQVAAMFLMYNCLAMSQLSVGVDNDTSCIFLASVTHFTFLSAFTWLNVMCFDIWLTLKNFSPRKSTYGRRAFGGRFVLYSLYAWGVPLLIVSIGQILQSAYGKGNTSVITPSFGAGWCWFPKNFSGPYWAYLYGPIGVLIFVNVLLFAMVLFNLLKAGSDNVLAATRERNKQKLCVILSLFILMGLSWTMEVISFAFSPDHKIWLVFDVLNVLTSVFMFVILVCKPNVWKQLKMKFPYLVRFDPYCPSFMNRVSTRRVVTSSRKSVVKNKLTAAHSNVSTNAKSSTDAASCSDDRAGMSLTSVTQVDRNSSQSNRRSSQTPHSNPIQTAI